MNQHLQRSYNKYGLDNFEMIVIEECLGNDLCINEQKWIDYYKPTGVYNARLYVYDLRGERNPNYGKKNSLEVKTKMTEARGKLKKKEVLEIVDFLRKGKLSHKEIANIYKIARNVITRISNGTRWTNITDGAVIPVIYKEDKREFSESHKKRIGQSHVGMKYNMKKKGEI